MNFLHDEEDRRSGFDMAGLTQDLLDLFREDGVEDVSASSMSTFARTEIWLQSATNDAELRVLVLYNGNIEVSRVQVNHPRTGVFTKIMEVIERACAQLHGTYVMISGVCTKEMASWCMKYDYDPVEATCFDSDGVTLGDYRRRVCYSGFPTTEVSGSDDETNESADGDPDGWSCDDSIYAASNTPEEDEGMGTS